MLAMLNSNNRLKQCSKILVYEQAGLAFIKVATKLTKASPSFYFYTIVTTKGDFHVC